MGKLRCSVCKEELPDDGRWHKGDKIYCAGKIPPHDHYIDYEQATENCAEQEIEESVIE